MFDKLFHPALRRHRFFGPFREHDLLALQLVDPGFIGGDHGRVGGVDDPIEQGFDLPFRVGNLCRQRGLGVAGGGQAHVPDVAEHGQGEVENLPGGLQGPENCFRAPFDLGAGNGLALGDAAGRVAEIVRVVGVAALRPAGGHGLAAVVADHEAPQREVLAYVLAGRGIDLAVQDRLDSLMRGETDDRLVMPPAQAHAPIRSLDISGIDGAGQDFLDLGGMDIAAHAALGEVRLRLQESLHLELRSEAPAGIAFQSLGQDRGDRLVADQQLAVNAVPRVAVADRLMKDVVAFLDPRLHLLDNLTAVLLPFKLPLRGDDGLDEAAFGRVLEIEVQAFDLCPALGEFPAQLDVEFGVAGEALEVIEDHDIGLAVLLTEIGEHRPHPGAFHEVAAAGAVIGEDRLDRIAFAVRMLATAMLLRFQPTALQLLLCGGDAAIDQRSLRLVVLSFSYLHVTVLPDADVIPDPGRR